MTKTSFQSILHNLRFSNNDNDDKTDKSNKICPVIKHLNKTWNKKMEHVNWTKKTS